MDHYTGRQPASCTPEPRPGPLPATFSRDVHGVPMIQFYGEIDLASAPEVRLRLDAVTARDRPRLIVDLRPTGFFDSSAMEELRRALQRTLERGGRIALICTDPFALRVLRAEGLSSVLPPVPTLEAALARIRETEPTA